MANGDGSAQALEHYRETSIAFDDLIVQVGRALGRAQEAMDASQVDFQRRVARALQEGRIRRLDVAPRGAFTIPETKLELKIGLSMRYPEGGGPPTLSAVPLNATTTNQNDIDVEAATEVRLRFVSVPPATEPPGPSPSAIGPDEARRLAQEEKGGVATWLEHLGELTVDVDYADASRLWTLAWLEAREPSLVAVVDDRRGEILGRVARRLPPAADELEPVGPPRLTRVEPAIGRRGDVLTVIGDNFLTLAGQTVLHVDGRPVPPLRPSMRALAFKLPDWATRGDVEILTPLGATGETGQALFTPLPGFDGFEPKVGDYDAVRRRGTRISVSGSNLRHGCTIRFATGVESGSVEVLSPGRMQVEVPDGAGSGPLTLVFGDHQESLPEIFFVLPRVDRVSPRQARVGDGVTLSGSRLENVTEVLIGAAPVPRSDFLLQTPDQIRFYVPAGASDGPLRVRESLGADLSREVTTRDIFYVVPRTTGFGESVVTPGRLLTIFGEGLDPEPDMMILLFDARGGWSEAPVLAVADDRGSLTTRVPADAVTGFVLLLRKRVYSEIAAGETSDLSRDKITVLTAEGDPSDLILEERFDGDLARWSVEAGSWRIDQGVLASEDTARLGLALSEARDELSIYADVLEAERFGFFWTRTGASERYQVWVDLSGSEPALTWSRVDDRGRQKLLGGMPLAVLSGDDHLAQVVLAGGKATFLLDQAEVHTLDGEVATGPFERLGLLADSPSQRWDNVVALQQGELRLPAPEVYRFGAVPEPPTPPALRLDTFEPQRGPEGTEVTLRGIGLDEAVHILFSGVEAEATEAAGGDTARFLVPAGARTGPIEAHGRGGAIATTGARWFVVPPAILNLVPSRVLAGETLSLIGTNLPTVIGAFEVRVLGEPAQVVAATASMLTVLVPDVVGVGTASVDYEGFRAQAPASLEVRREETVLDLIETAERASWTTSAGSVTFGAAGERDEAAIQLRGSERLEDGVRHENVLFVHPPAPSLRALRGVYPPLDVPAGRLELRLRLGMLESAAPAAAEVADVDGVVFEVAFLTSDTGVEIPLLPRTTCIHDGSLERFVIDGAPVTGRSGPFVVTVLAGRSGFRDDAALVTAALVAVT